MLKQVNTVDELVTKLAEAGITGVKAQNVLLETHTRLNYRCQVDANRRYLNVRNLQITSVSKMRYST